MPNYLWILFFLCIVFLTPLQAELLVLEVVANETSRGEFFVEKDEQGRFWLPVDQLDDFGLLISPVKIVEKSGISYFSFDEFPPISAEFDESTLRLLLIAPPEYFPETNLDLSGKRQRRIAQSLEDSAFLNYQFNVEQDSLQSGSAYGLESEVGIRRHAWLFLSGQRLTQDDAAQSGFFRLMSSATYEWREDLKRLVIGDAISSANALTPTTRFAGINFSRNFELNPQFIQYPTLEYSGSVSAPAEIDIYLDGLKIRTEKIPPGNFRLENFTGMMGYGDIELVVRDQFGRENRMKSPYYLANQLLKPGLHEYSYGFGLLRENYGTEKDGYGSPVLLAYHRYGWNSRTTAGYRLYADDSLLFLSPSLDLLAATFGTMNLTTGISSGNGESGAAGVMRYVFTRRPVNTYLSYGSYTKGFTSPGSATMSSQPKSTFGAGLGWGSLRLGSFSVDLADNRMQEGEGRRTLGFSYSRRLFRQVTMTFSYQHSQGASDYSSSYLSFYYVPATGARLTARLETQENSRTVTVQAQENPPSGVGYGYVASLGQRFSADESTTLFTPSTQINREYGIVRGDLRVEQGGDNPGSALSLSAAGALTWLGGVFRPSRPVNDSFALVQVGGLEGVQVRHNGQTIGRTDDKGRILLPEINAYYDNQISIDDKDVPFNYSLFGVEQYISPPARSGSCVVFDVQKSQPVTGHLYVEYEGELQPLEFREVELMNDQGQIQTIPTGRGGEFYFDPSEFKSSVDPLPMETGCRGLMQEAEPLTKTHLYSAKIRINDKKHDFVLHIPLKDDLFIDLGQVIIAGEEKYEK
ncbi:MAG: fimbrial biogenesis outer membrane usher protein [Desulfuromonadales bacterium]|nr:fimbrial biogenesis outer membrane usher protein [Desulfuromonadales bacterium]